MPVSANDPFERKRVSVLDSEMAYVDTGSGDPVVFLHGNPTSSYLWRNIIPHVEKKARCLAPDLIGMGQSGKNPSGSYRFVDHARYLDAWFEAVLPDANNITFVIHDWGSALGFYWTQRHPQRVKGIVYMEAIVQALSWATWPEQARELFQGLRSPAGEEMILEKNIFVENILPGSVMRDLTEEEMAAYRKPYLETGESRRPTLTWPREIPIDGEPKDTHDIITAYGEWLKTSDDLPKLLIKGEPGTILTGKPLAFAQSWPKQSEVTVKGIHFLQEDSPDEIGQAIVEFLG